MLCIWTYLDFPGESSLYQMLKGWGVGVGAAISLLSTIDLKVSSQTKPEFLSAIVILSEETT